MTGTSIEIRLAVLEEEPIIRDLLARCELPCEDISHHLGRFHVAVTGDCVIGIVGIEIYGNVALLRSLAVSRPFRSRGTGRLLCEKTESYARAHWVEDLYLLTTSAAGFFTKLGFTIIGREKVPSEIKATNRVCFRLPIDCNLYDEALSEK